MHSLRTLSQRVLRVGTVLLALDIPAIAAADQVMHDHDQDR